MTRASHIAAVTLLVAVAAWPLMGAAAQDEPDASYSSLQALPDLGGTWLPTVGPFGDGGGTARLPLPPELKPEAAEAATRFRNDLLAGAALDRGYCRPAAFGGRMPINAGGAFEILYTPGRVTVAVENGLVRRIYLRDEPPPGALTASRGGTSVGRWEDGALVVRTTGLDPQAWFLSGLPIGEGAEVSERFVLEEPELLAIETTTIAPEILAAPLTTVLRFRRARERPFTEFDICVPDDRSYDAESAREQFDMTPPSDLPPPPEPE